MTIAIVVLVLLSADLASSLMFMARDLREERSDNRTLRYAVEGANYRYHLTDLTYWAAIIDDAWRAHVALTPSETPDVAR
jgi:hypothetical protein